MNLNKKFLNNISDDQAIFTGNFIYRKMKNLNNTYDIYVLTRLDNRFVWSKTNDYLNDINNSTITTENFNDLRCMNSDNKYLTIYRLYEGMTTNVMIYNSENMLVWNNLNIPMDINELNTISLLDIPSHIDLTKEQEKECEEDGEGNVYDEGIPFDLNLEPLCGWDNLLKREPPDEIFVNDDSYFTNTGEKDISFNKDLVLDIPPVEYRIDPYDNEWYTKEEFLEYYSGLVEWNNQDPKLVLRREQYYHFYEKFNHLDDRRFEYLFKKYEKTFV